MKQLLGNVVEAYTERTFEALVTSLVPETPQLARQLGEEHEPGASGLGLNELMARAFDSIQATEFSWGVAESSDEVPDKQKLSPLAALILDYGAIEYVLSGRGNPVPNPALGGPFCWISTEQRLDVLDYLSNESTVIRLSEALNDVIPHLGLVEFMLDGLVTMVLINYYGEWTGYEDQEALTPAPDSFSGEVQSWQQTKFPGQQPGYSVFRGYECEEFKENDLS